MRPGGLRSYLRRQTWWLQLRELEREGWNNAYRRKRIQDSILASPPLRTDSRGDVEVRALTWRRDWKNLLWALKSFYHFAGRSYPLYIHDGGLSQEGAAALHEHFPDARIVSRQEADQAVDRHFSSRGWERCLAYRKKNPTTLKLFDFFVMSRAQTIFSIDSDIVFFAPPVELLNCYPGKNVFNRDASCQYSMTMDELEALSGIPPVADINSGLSRIERRSIDFAAINGWLANPKMFADNWVTEQTLHALCSTAFGVELLPPTYAVGVEPGFVDGIVCKHYPGNIRPLLYQEGMRRLAATAFFGDLASIR